jgi:hypothetical protein
MKPPEARLADHRARVDDADEHADPARLDAESRAIAGASTAAHVAASESEDLDRERRGERDGREAPASCRHARCATTLRVGVTMHVDGESCAAAGTRRPAARRMRRRCAARRAAAAAAAGRSSRRRSRGAARRVERHARHEREPRRPATHAARSARGSGMPR